MAVHPAQAKPVEAKKSNKKVLIIFAGIFGLIVVGAAGYLGYKQLLPRLTAEKKDHAKPGEGAKVVTSLPRFAEWKEEKTDIVAAVPDYTINYKELENLKDVGEARGNFGSDELEALEDPGFFVEPAFNKLAEEIIMDFRHGGAVDEFILHYQDVTGDSMESYRRPENAVFISSDFLLHVFHVFLERTFEYIEQTQFHPNILSLTNILYEECLAEYQAATNEQLKASFKRLTTFYLIPKVILETSEPIKEAQNPMEEEQERTGDKEVDTAEKISAAMDSYKNEVGDEIYQTAKAEIELINAADKAVSSPLFGEFMPRDKHDYTQYKPRSHYTKNSVLRSYWKALIWYGRNGFLLKSDDLTRDAMVQTLLLGRVHKGEQSALSLWESVYQPTVFFVGKADDLTHYDYQKLVNEIYGIDVSYKDLLDGSKFNEFKEKAKDLRGPGIQSSIILVIPGADTEEELLEETKGWRFMGQRFIPDSFIFSELTQGDTAPDPETGQMLPAVPTGLMVMDIFGSQRATNHLDTWINREAPDSNLVLANKIKKLKEAFNTFGEEEWTQNLYWSWLYSLQPLWQSFGEGYPLFMQSVEWRDKDLNASLGSWTELRHDTLLYAKQSYAELGAGGDIGEPPPVPKGYVEPNVQFLNRIIALLQMTEEGLEKNGVFPEQQQWKAKTLGETFRFYRDIAVKQLANETISDEDFEKLRISPMRINDALTPATGSMISSKEVRSGLIADVHTAMTMERQEVLYEATGIPNIIYVAVKDKNGTRLTRGLTYSYYEFTRPFGERLSDQDWQGVIYEGSGEFTPQAPDWTIEFRR
jgi:hypothetical protein